MAEEIQGCEHCQKSFPIGTMALMEGCWFCEECTTAFQNAFDACEHHWSDHRDEMGDDGKVCERCCGFVRNEDFPLMFGRPAALGE